MYGILLGEASAESGEPTRGQWIRNETQNSHTLLLQVCLTTT